MFLDLKFDNNLKIIDTHCHLDSDVFLSDLELVLDHSFKNGIDKVIIPGASIKDLKRAKEIAHKYQQVYFAVGIHPYDIDHYDEYTLREFLKDYKCIAIGECGLDYYRLNSKDEEIKKKQKEIFIAQLDLAVEFKKPVIIHSREANEDTYNILKEYSSKLNGGVLHCFNASELLLDLAQMGFYFGIGGIVTFKNAKKLVQILPKIPKDKLLIETDAPYLTPEPFRGQRNTPLLTQLVGKKMSEILDIPHEELLKLCYQNSINLFFKEN
ncbi:TatD family deoxyribonuclease [Campylobacter novaezeelandiae]|uniref:TatD family deoxyribonuclease n=1 Tax=Campylobacter novaezeelandiae TaxID=2267891 RepID=A0A4Q9JUM4_9BACT|nr:TatD family hydrolase [Campylobacter novaezeelandiae]TBR78900.1 TatD family deoxyribonuclease [Campylobacter novaezeelandiae]TBR79390.1 TatD family deoxyribonuclease [Campylobacter novaezeelandiae]